MKTKYKKILVISDNSFLCERFLEIIEKKSMPNCIFSFAISPFSNLIDFKIADKIDFAILDLKLVDDISFIKSNYDLIFSIHCKQIFPLDLVNSIKCINVHPGYNPINRGWYPQVFSIINKLDIGATIHEIDEKLDHGFIIAREFVEKNSFDTSEALYNKVVEKELELLDKYLENIINNTYVTIVPENEGNLYLKNDFNDLLELDLTEQISIGDFIDRLRALTHGSFDNAYFIDSETGKRIFVGIKLKEEGNE